MENVKYTLLFLLVFGGVTLYSPSEGEIDPFSQGGDAA